MTLSVVLINSHEALREGLGLLLTRAGCVVRASTGSVADGLALVDRLQPDVTLIDADTGDCDGIELARRVRAFGLRGAVVLYASAVDTVTLEAVLESGVRGVALKDGTLGELIELLESVAAGATCIDARLVRKLSELPGARLTVLSKRENEVMELLSEGLTGEQIAQRLVLSIQTVKTHVRNAMVKLEASTRAHAIAIAMREGYISGGRRAAGRERRPQVAA